MKVLKSPVFYFGIVLLLAVSFALLAPYVVDWGRYRNGLEAWGQKLTGRDVAIRGDIAVRLFPFPQLMADNVVIANPEGFREPVFASIERVSVKVTLGGLINGDLQVESIDIQKPVVNLERRSDNRLNLAFAPAVSISSSPLLDQVQLDQISVLGGEIYVLDSVRDSKTVFSGINATLSAATLAGPWRSTGTLQANGTPVSFSLSTASWDGVKPLRYSLRLSPGEQAGYAAMIDGESALDGRVKGELRLEPLVDGEGKSNTEGRFRSVRMKAKYEADFTRIDLSEIEIRPADNSDQGTLITGKGRAVIGKQVEAAIDIVAPRVDLDVLAGAGSRQLLRDGGGLALLNGLLRSLPSNLQLDAAVKVQALRAGGELLENTELAFQTGAELVRISRLAANLPGRTRMLFSGVFFPGERFAELGGKLALDTADTRQLTSWLWPEGKAELARVWTGSRGRLKAEGEVRLTVSKLEFRDVVFELNGDQGKGRLSMLVNGERPILDLELKASRIDVDAFMPSGVGSLTSTGGLRWTSLLQGFLEEQSRRDMRLVLNADRLLLNGVEAEKLSADLETTVRGIDVKTLSIGSVGGASLTAAGVMLNTEAGADGDIDTRIAAEDPRGLFRLMGLVPRNADPAWIRPLGRTAMRIALQARAGNAPGSIGIVVDGNSGPFAVSGSGELSTLLAGGLAFKGSGNVSSAGSGELWQLLGGTAQAADRQRASVSVTADGSTLAGFKTEVMLDLYGTQGSFAGTANLSASPPMAQGKVQIAAGNIVTLAQVIGLPLVDQQSAAFKASADLKMIGSDKIVEGIEGALDGEPLSGSIRLANGREISGELTVARASIAQGLAAALLPWNGEVASSESLFASQPPFGISGELWIRPKVMDVYPGYSVPDGQIGIKASGPSTQFVAYGKSSNGDKISLELNLDAALAQRKIKASVVMPFRLETVLSEDNGAKPAAGLVNVDMKLEGQGLSPAAVLAELSGNGALQVTDLVLLGVTPARFTQSIGAVKDADQLAASLQAMLEGDGLRLSPTFGSVSIQQGIATLTPFGIETPDASVTLSPVIDLPSGRLRIPIALDLKALAGLPRMAIVYAGPPQNLTRRVEASELSAFLGFKILQQGVDELEKVQAEQARLAREEEEMRRADQQKLDQYYAQRTELRLRQRELRIFAAQRLIDAEKAAARQAILLDEGRAMNKLELERRLRELAVFGRPLRAGAGPLVRPRLKPQVPQLPEQAPVAPEPAPG